MGKSISKIKEEYERNKLLLKKKGTNLELVDLIFGSKDSEDGYNEKVVDFNEDEEVVGTRVSKEAIEGVIEFSDEESPFKSTLF